MQSFRDGIVMDCARICRDSRKVDSTIFTHERRKSVAHMQEKNGKGHCGYMHHA